MFITICVCGMMAAWARDGATPKAAKSPTLKLAPNARLEISPVRIAKDSLQASILLEVVPTAKFQRHRCVISANRKDFKLTVPKTQSWMLRQDTLIVLSSVELTVLTKKVSGEPLELHFDFVNLDNHQAEHGAAILILGKSGDTSEHAVAAAASDSSAKSEVATSADSATQTSVSETARESVSAPADSTNADRSNDASGDLMSWILIALLIPGFAILALLNYLSRKRSREAIDKITLSGSTERISAARREERAAAFKNPARRHGPPESVVPTSQPEAKESKKASEPPDPSSTIPAASVLALTKSGSGMEGIIALPDLQAALAQLCAVTAEVQKAVGKQFDALQKISMQVESARMLPAQAASLQSQPRLQFASEYEDRAVAGAETQNSMNDRALQDLGVKVAAPRDARENYEEIADAIASLAAASTIKPAAVPAQTLAPKLALLHKIYEGLQKLAGLSRASATGVPAESVETLLRRVRELRMSYEAWATDQSLKMPLMLQRPENGGDHARRKIVESLLDGLHETRKIAVQGSLYFERRFSQLLEHDLPNLRAQFSGEHNAEAQKIWEHMV